MSKKIYMGISDVAKNCKKAYIGVSNKARKIKKMYVGIDNIAKEFYSSSIPTTSEVHFEIGSFSTGATRITGQATARLQDGDLPTMEITTDYAPGFELSTSNSLTTIGVCGVVASTLEAQISSINEILNRTSAKTNYYIRFKSQSAYPDETYCSVKEIVFDFKKSRNVTLKLYYSWSRANGTYSSWKGSNDGTTWTNIKTDIESGGVRTITNTTAYRYFKYTTQSYEQHGIALMYFTNVSDSTEI